MDDRDEIAACYKAMYQGMVKKDCDQLKTCLDESYVLTHMTGSRMNREEFFQALANGVLNYYAFQHVNLPVEVKGGQARLKGDTRVLAAVYGGGKNWWDFRLDCCFVKKNGKWMMTSSKASTF